jgi:glutamine amidotransferase
MQLLARKGTEDGDSEGLGFFDAVVERLPASAPHVPHVGFNRVRFTPAARALGAALGDGADCYFVHSYRMVCRDSDDVAGWCEYGEPFAALVRKGQVAGAQFHPEKSQSNGLKLLAAFLSPSFLSS